jgi:hypothetical protein
LEKDELLPEKNRFLEFEDKREVEPVWNGWGQYRGKSPLTHSPLAPTMKKSLISTNTRFPQKPLKSVGGFFIGIQRYYQSISMAQVPL